MAGLLPRACSIMGGKGWADDSQACFPWVFCLKPITLCGNQGFAVSLHAWKQHYKHLFCFLSMKPDQKINIFAEPLLLSWKKTVKRDWWGQKNLWLWKSVTINICCLGDWPRIIFVLACWYFYGRTSKVIAFRHWREEFKCFLVLGKGMLWFYKFNEISTFRWYFMYNSDLWPIHDLTRRLRLKDYLISISEQVDFLALSPRCYREIGFKRT